MNWFWMLCCLAVWLTVCMFQVQASLVNIESVAPDVAVLSGNKNQGAGISKNAVRGKQESRSRIDNIKTGGAGQTGGGGDGEGGGGGGLLGGLV